MGTDRHKTPRVHRRQVVGGVTHHGCLSLQKILAQGAPFNGAGGQCLGTGIIVVAGIIGIDLDTGDRIRTEQEKTLRDSKSSRRYRP